MLFMRPSTLLLGAIFFTVTASAQTADDLLRLLVTKGSISEKEADSLRRDYSSRRNREDAAADSFPLRLSRSLSLSGYSQAVYAGYRHPLAGKYSDGFGIKRARLDFQGHFSSRFDYRLLVDFVGQSGANGTAPAGGQLISPFLVEANLTYKPFDFLNFKAGQMIVAFSQENISQDRSLDLIERSQVVNALVGRKGDAADPLVDSLGNQNGRDIGIQVNGSLFRWRGCYLLDYFFQLLNGAGINTLDNNQSKDIDARLVLHPFKQLSFGGSYYNGFDRFTGTLAKDQKRIRWGAEMALNYDLFSVKGEYIRGQEGSPQLSHPQGGDGITTHEGWYGQAAFFVLPHRLQAVFRYDSYDPNTAKTRVISTYYDFGVNYLFNVWTKIQLYYSLRNHQDAVVNNNLFEAQFQLAF